jgi:hypothetical protein
MFALVFFPVSGYLEAMAMGALEFYGCFHDFIVILCVSVVITPLSYFVDHSPMIYVMLLDGLYHAVDDLYHDPGDVYHV